ncbi:hypothetical protein ACP70R_004286 [Stipagrostis hirtigluma subsp. patula]
MEIGLRCAPAGLGLSRLDLSDLVLTDITATLPALHCNLQRKRHHFPRTPPHTAPLELPCAPRCSRLPAPLSPRHRCCRRHLCSGVRATPHLNQLQSFEAHQFLGCHSCHLPSGREGATGAPPPEYAYNESDVFILRRRLRQ